LEGLAKEDVGIFYSHLVYFTALWYFMWPFGIFMVIWYIFPHFWYVVPGKIWQNSNRFNVNYASSASKAER
jgi:hypothetical protein